tara:strand:- start:8288 stop:8761 length:474 start_codon:yes stop_codon:yes gene_type:complete
MNIGEGLTARPLRKGRFVPTELERQEVQLYAGRGISKSQIAIRIRDGIAISTLLSHFAYELEKGMSDANYQVHNALYEKAISGDTAACIWWTKARSEWKEDKSIVLEVEKKAPAIIMLESIEAIATTLVEDEDEEEDEDDADYYEPESESEEDAPQE